MPIGFDLSKYDYNQIFIETGTYIGEGIERALKCKFQKIYSIEIDEFRFNDCKTRFENEPRVEIIFGDSSVELKKLLEKINEPCTLFLDAHYCADGATIGDKWCPLKEEFLALLEHPIKNHTIIIDDWRCMNNTHIDYSWIDQKCKLVYETYVDKKKGKEVGFLGKDNCLNLLKEINKDYQIIFENGCEPEDVVVAKI